MWIFNMSNDESEEEQKPVIVSVQARMALKSLDFVADDSIVVPVNKSDTKECPKNHVDPSGAALLLHMCKM